MTSKGKKNKQKKSYNLHIWRILSSFSLISLHATFREIITKYVTLLCCFVMRFLNYRGDIVYNCLKYLLYKFHLKGLVSRVEIHLFKKYFKLTLIQAVRQIPSNHPWIKISVSALGSYVLPNGRRPPHSWRGSATSGLFGVNRKMYVLGSRLTTLGLFGVKLSTRDTLHPDLTVSKQGLPWRKKLPWNISWPKTIKKYLHIWIIRFLIFLFMLFYV